jgi:hypothetical protein
MQVVLRISYSVTFAGFPHHAKAAANVIHDFNQTKFMNAVPCKAHGKESSHG